MFFFALSMLSKIDAYVFKDMLISMITNYFAIMLIMYEYGNNVSMKV
jgi:hypothetical protein